MSSRFGGGSRCGRGRARAGRSRRWRRRRKSGELAGELGGCLRMLKLHGSESSFSLEGKYEPWSASGGTAEKGKKKLDSLHRLPFAPQRSQTSSLPPRELR